MKSPIYTVNIDLSVLKALTAKLEVDGQTHNDVLRDLLGIDSPLEAEDPNAAFSNVADAIGRVQYPGQYYSRGLALPDGTELRARYKGVEYRAVIRNGSWLDDSNQVQQSPSAAANKITSTVVNGLRFWEARRPGDPGWRRLDVIRDSLRK